MTDQNGRRSFTLPLRPNGQLIPPLHASGVDDGPPAHAFGVDDVELTRFVFPILFSAWVTSAEHDWVILA